MGKRNKLGLIWRLSISLGFLLPLVSCNDAGKLYPDQFKNENISEKWWKESVVYQIYPRSFKDSDGDGIGDLNGITSQLDYIKNLGANVIWLCPIYQSPNDDNGYDISDYYSVMKDFGSMADFDNMLSEMHKRGLKLMMDMVGIYTSDEHRWFKESRKSKNNPYRNFYIWKDPVNNSAPNDWVSYFGGSAWEFDAKTKQYYLHYFTKKQAALNWFNPDVRKEMHKVMRFWLDKGVDGYRLDVISMLTYDTTFAPLGNRKHEDVYANNVNIHEYLQEINRDVFSKYDMFTVGEGVGIQSDNAWKYVNESRNELSMIFEFDQWFFDRDNDKYKGKQWALPDFKKIFLKWDTLLSAKGWNSIYLGNHDVPRVVSRYGDDKRFRQESAKMLATFLLTMRGTPYIFEGDELAMANPPFELNDYRDIEALNYIRDNRAAGLSDNEILFRLNTYGRDNARSLMQWDTTKNGGFSTSNTTWIGINPDYKTVNAYEAQKDSNSVFHYYKKMIDLRKEHNALVYGNYNDIAPADSSVYAYTRVLNDTSFLIVMNFKGGKQIPFNLPECIQGQKKTLLISNYSLPKDEMGTLTLKPYEARVYLLQ